MRLNKIILLVTTIGCSTSFAVEPTNTLHLDWIDSKVPLQQNFYGYANGNWQKQHPIPPEYASWSVFHELYEDNLKKIRQILEQAAADKKAVPGSIEQKVGDFYYSGMDEERINKLGATPLSDEFLRINTLSSTKELPAELAHLHLLGVNALFSFGSMTDFANSTQQIAAIMQGGLGLPDRDYYLKKDKKFTAIRNAYEQHITRMFILLGETPAKASSNAVTVLALETALAKASLSQTAQRDPHAIYHLMSVSEIENMTPNFSWQAYFSQLKHPEINHANVGMPHYIRIMHNLINAYSINDWKIYLRWHVIDTYAPYLSKPFVDDDFRMTTALTGAEKLSPRWKRVVNTENGALGFAVGELYVQKYFSEKAKENVLTMILNIRQALQNDLMALKWMSPSTRKAALNKLSHMEERVGYPDKWWDYSSLMIDRTSYLLNVMRANEFLTTRDLNKIGKPIDKTEWDMTPQTINAYYNPSMNNINIPAGILQPPFYDPNAPAAVNYGAIGFVIGHEITHGFDDQGAKFDANGNLHDWWTPLDLQKFKTATQCIVNQFSNYTVADNLQVNGKLVVGEATADLGGLTLAYRAFHASKDYQTSPTLQGLTPDQLFFLSMAHTWANNTRPEQARNLITTDPHPPGLWRVNGTLANMPAFQAAFHLDDNRFMANRHRCIIW
jgi:putative endopeptidase